MFFPLLFGVTISVVGVVHTGQRTLPPAVTVSLPRFPHSCNTFSSFSIPFSIFQEWFQAQKLLRAFFFLPLA